MSTIIAKLLASTVLKKIGKAILISLLTELSKQTDNKIDDQIVKAVKDALD